MAATSKSTSPFQRVSSGGRDGGRRARGGSREGGDIDLAHEKEGGFTGVGDNETKKMVQAGKFLSELFISDR